MKSARELAHELAGCEDDYTYAAEFVPRRHRSICDRLTAAIEARDGEHKKTLVDADFDCVAANEKLDASLAALKVARKAMEAAQYQLPYPGDVYEILRRALTRISELVKP